MSRAVTADGDPPSIDSLVRYVVRMEEKSEQCSHTTYENILAVSSIARRPHCFVNIRTIAHDRAVISNKTFKNAFSVASKSYGPGGHLARMENTNLAVLNLLREEARRRIEMRH